MLSIRTTNSTVNISRHRIVVIDLHVLLFLSSSWSTKRLGSGLGLDVQSSRKAHVSKRVILSTETGIVEAENVHNSGIKSVPIGHRVWSSFGCSRSQSIGESDIQHVHPTHAGAVTMLLVHWQSFGPSRSPYQYRRLAYSAEVRSQSSRIEKPTKPNQPTHRSERPDIHLSIEQIDPFGLQRLCCFI